MVSVDKIDKKINHIIIQHHYIDVFNIVTFIAIITMWLQLFVQQCTVQPQLAMPHQI